MAYMTTVLIVVQVLSAIAIIVLVLLQHGKGADMGAAFGGGASGSLFGATGSANFLSRSTGAVATLFFLATLGLAYTGTTGRPSPAPGGGGGVMSTVPAQPPSKAAEIPGAAPAKPADVPVPPAEPAKDGSGTKPADIPK